MAYEIDWKNPDYGPIFQERMARLTRIRQSDDPALTVAGLKRYYRDHIADFIADWGMTYDPRNPERGIQATVPFLLFDRQREFVDWVIGHWRAQRSGLSDKSREVGVSWLVVAIACSMCLLYDGVSIGFGSRKAEYVDNLGELKALIPKARVFLRHVPAEFRGGWTEKDAPHMQVRIPETGSAIGGEGGDSIGRGDRRSIYFVDEAAHLERPKLVDLALSMTTNCRIDVSSVNGRSNSFAEKRFRLPPDDVFTFHWRDDPRKDDAWYARKCEELDDPVVIAQELDLDYFASVEGALIPSAWVQSAVDAHLKIGIAISGRRSAALDVADEGRDTNAIAGGQGILLDAMDEWSGAGIDIYQTTLKAFAFCDENECDFLRFDADGLGAGVRGDAAAINLQHRPTNKIAVTPFRGSASPFDPDGEAIKGRTNSDYFANAKAQAWWLLRRRFERTHRAVTQGIVAPHDDLISISSRIKHLNRLCIELSQPSYSINGAGKIMIDKAPDGAKSPNLGDAVMMRFAPMSREMAIPVAVVDQLRRRDAARRLSL